MQSDIFPSYAVKQALKELDIEREDDAIITGIQNELLPQCAVMLIKNCILSAIHNNRKFVGAVDIQFAISTVHIPKGEILSENVGYLMNTKHFGSMAFSMLQIISASFETYGIKADDKKISSECILLQRLAC